MSNQHPVTIECQICKKSKKPNELVPGMLVRQPIINVIIKEYPQWSGTGFICRADLNRFRESYLEDLIKTDQGELSAIETEVIKSLAEEQEMLSKNINIEFDQTLTVGERIADKVAEFGGSWRFILSFATFLIVWIAFNSIALWRQPFDPYPFILLNLILSCLAAVQAPIIMMSQNRVEAKDRLRAEHDYRVNLKAELEIRHIIVELDQLVNHQWQRLLEIQRLQMELLEESERRGPRTPKTPS